MEEVFVTIEPSEGRGGELGFHYGIDGLQCADWITPLRRCYRVEWVTFVNENTRIVIRSFAFVDETEAGTFFDACSKLLKAR